MKKALILTAVTLLLALTYSSAQINTGSNGKGNTSFEPLNSNNGLKTTFRKKITPTAILFKNYSIHLKRIGNITAMPGPAVHHYYYPFTTCLYPNKTRFDRIDLYAPRLTPINMRSERLVPHIEYFKAVDLNTDDGSGLNIRLTDNTSLNMGFTDYEGMPDAMNNGSLPDISDSVNEDNGLDISLSLVVTIH